MKANSKVNPLLSELAGQSKKQFQKQRNNSKIKFLQGNQESYSQKSNTVFNKNFDITNNYYSLNKQFNLNSNSNCIKRNLYGFEYSRLYQKMRNKINLNEEINRNTCFFKKEEITKLGTEIISSNPFIIQNISSIFQKAFLTYLFLHLEIGLEKKEHHFSIISLNQSLRNCFFITKACSYLMSLKEELIRLYQSIIENEVLLQRNIMKM